MAERTEELKREIEHTRNHMGTTLDAIGDRVSPGRVVERRWTRVRQSASRAGQSIMGTPRSAAGSVKGHLSEASSSTASVAGSAASSVSDAAGSAASSVSEAISSAPDRIQAGTQGNPLAAGALAFGVGVLIGSMAPPSQEETQLAERVMEPLQHEAQALTKEVASSVKEQAQEGMEQTKAAAQESATQVMEQAQGAAQQVSEQAAQAKTEVAGQAQSAAEDVRSTSGS